MSKRFVLNQQYGDRKKAKLNVTISDHNFPLSQNSKAPEQDNWGDENDDEILLLASQACEQVYNDISSLPDYSMCMQPATTSTQYEPTPSTSKGTFTFKKPSTNPPSAIATHLKNKCHTISSPLPGMSNKVTCNQNEKFNYRDEIVFNDKICKTQDQDFIYRQLLEMQEENAKLKSENGKLLEKCVTKEGEASILRTQLKSCQIAVDNARMDKIKAQEKLEVDWMEKLQTVSSQMQDLRTQLDFKNLEIISIKEKCKKLESNKLRLTQITVGNNDISSSHRNNNKIFPNEPMSQMRKIKMTSNAIQTDDKAAFIKLSKICRNGNSKLISILPLILESKTQQQHSILEYNEKLQKQSEYSQNTCRIFSTFHRIPSTPTPNKLTFKSKLNLNHIYEDLTFIAAKNGDYESIKAKYFNLFSAIDLVLQDVQCELDTISLRVTNTFQKEMDEKYIESTATFLSIKREDLLKSSALYKDEQAIFARRMVALTSYVLETPESVNLYKMFEEQSRSSSRVSFVDNINRICSLLDSSSCAVIHSGFLLALTFLLSDFLQNIPEHKTKIVDVIKVILGSRPMSFVSCNMLVLIRKLSVSEDFMFTFCPKNNSCNLKVDYDQGVLLYKKDSCYFQILIKQIEVSLKCIESQNLTDEALETSSNLIAVYSNISDNSNGFNQNAKCDCQLMLMQVIVFSLRICAVMLKNLKDKVTENASTNHRLLAVCRSGIRILYQTSLRDVEFSSQLAHNEGHLIDFCEILKEFDHNEIYGNMLSELTSTFQASLEETSVSFQKQPWLNSFKCFSLLD
ncbi:unnamed protein product [Diatraea saccharalis]|uniref:Uncharacterized protein n=1 Tax=Diatraea saccharalis TaxID=40085 RepID=A0A9N9N1W1_9NEOP|nr:unnamed protein product [Diatraea saccharalis]